MIKYLAGKLLKPNFILIQFIKNHRFPYSSKLLKLLVKLDTKLMLIAIYGKLR